MTSCLIVNSQPAKKLDFRLKLSFRAPVGNLDFCSPFGEERRCGQATAGHTDYQNILA